MPAAGRRQRTEPVGPDAGAPLRIAPEAPEAAADAPAEAAVPAPDAPQTAEPQTAEPQTAEPAPIESEVSEQDAEAAVVVLPLDLGEQIATHRRPDHAHSQRFLGPLGDQEPHHGLPAAGGAFDDHRPGLGQLLAAIHVRPGEHLDRAGNDPSLVVTRLDPNIWEDDWHRQLPA
jgi:hypothetical protein